MSFTQTREQERVSVPPFLVGLKNAVLLSYSYQSESQSKYSNKRGIKIVVVVCEPD